MCDTVFDECVLASASARGICCVLASGLCWLEYPFFGMSRVDAGGQPDLGAAAVFGAGRGKVLKTLVPFLWLQPVAQHSQPVLM